MQPRVDSWYANISEEQLWTLYAVARRSRNWADVVRIANEEMHLGVTVSRSAYYRWYDFMREHESERRLIEARIAATEAEQLAKGKTLGDETAIRAYKTLAAEYALKSDAATAGKFMQLATALIDRSIAAKSVKLKERDLDRKDEELKIAQQKLEIELAKSAKAVEAVTAPELTDEERVARVKSIFGIG